MNRATSTPPVGASTDVLARVDARASPVSRPPPMAAVQRVLIGTGSDLSEARIRIADGAGGATEIRLAVARDGTTVAWQLLTATTGSRETLSDVMKEVRLRLRRRGIVLTGEDRRGSPAEGGPGRENMR